MTFGQLKEGEHFTVVGLPYSFVKYKEQFTNAVSAIGNRFHFKDGDPVNAIGTNR